MTTKPSCLLFKVEIIYVSVELALGSLKIIQVRVLV